MSKKFNITGTCIPQLHYMADTSEKIEQILKIIEAGEYFAINRPRQYGKTTTMYLLDQALKKRKDYLVLKISFEAIDAPTYSRQEGFIAAFLDMLREKFLFLEKQDFADIISREMPAVRTMRELASLITALVQKIALKTVLMIDEVDKSSNNELFLDFLGMLRTKYLKRSEGEDYTFFSVILAGVHDVKTLKAKIPGAAEKVKFNSPWNIAVDFKVDLSLFPGEIEPMLEDYARDRGIVLDVSRFAGKLFYYTSGYPFLVSKLCKIIDEEILPQIPKKEWTEDHLEKAVQLILKEESTNFSTLIKNLENNESLYESVHDVIIKGLRRSFNRDNPVIDMGAAYGIFREEEGRVKIHNRIYEQRIYNYMSSKAETSEMFNYNFSDNFIEAGGFLNFEKVLLKFQEFMREQYSRKDEKFLERNGRLLFLAFLKPIINARGFDFKEVEISEEKRLDVVVTYLNRKYIIELKRWQGEKAHEKGIVQLVDYLERQGQEEGFLIIFDFRKSSETERLKTKSQHLTVGDKKIFLVRV
ncbi:MAG: AAA-like domain-containing protein [Candidatus Aminicenantes bacterium]|nr:AAA-like domain-containing protein [Candidatus Aminicenantes bacterium]